MKTITRIIALALVLASLLSLAVGCKKTEKKATESAVNVSFSYEYVPTPINASYQKSDVFMHNPDRGFRVHNVIRVNELTPLVGDQEALEKKAEELLFHYTNHIKEPWSLMYCYIYISPWNKERLPEEALTAIEEIFKSARKNKIKLLASFCYNESVMEGGRIELDRVCASEKVILMHIDQLAPIVAEYKDCIFSIKNGFIGYVGEWSATYQYPEVDYDKVTKAIVDKLCAPNEIFFSQRLPEYTVSTIKRYPDWENAKWIGFNNCAFYGEQTKDGWHSEQFQVGNNEGWWEYICENGAYFPVSGEMYNTNYLDSLDILIDPKEAILELAHHWHTVLSFYHGKYDSPSYMTKSIVEWEREEINPEWLDANGIIYDPNYFLDDNGNTVIRNCYEFIRDHLGYKIVAEKIKVVAKDGKVSISMDFKNYGFSAAFNLKSGFAILDENYNPITEIEVGDPTKWYSHDPENWQSTEVLDHSLSAELDAPTTSGKYYITFFLRNTMGVGAHLSNDMLFENNYNILYSFEV